MDRAREFVQRLDQSERLPEYLRGWVAGQLRALGLHEVRVTQVDVPIRGSDGAADVESFVAIQLTGERSEPLTLRAVAYDLERNIDRERVVSQWAERVGLSGGA
jgi:hypothetical protein